MTLNMEKQSFDSIIEQHFPKDIQQKRIRKELLSLNELDKEAFKINLLNSTLGLKVIVEISPQLFEENPKIHDNLNFPIIIELLLDPQFPFNLPKLFCQTNIFEPSLADARDFLEDTIEKPWSPTILLREVINTVPNFLSKMALLENPLDSQSYGKYHIGELYNLEDLLGYENIVLFSSEEIIAKKRQIPRYLMVAESYFLIFEIVDKTKNILRLFDSTKIQSIINLKKGKEEDKTLAFTFIDKERQGGVAQYKFTLNEATELLELLIAKGQKYGVKISGAVKKKLDISYYSSRITLPVDEDNIEETLEDIEELERRVEKDVSKDVVYTLMAYYQKVVEHFAVYDDDSVGDFVKKLRNLMEREDVQNTLKNTPEEQPKNNKVLTKKLTEDTDIDEEEKKEEGNDQPFSWPEKENEFIVGNSPKFEGREQREEIFIGGNRGVEQKVEERVNKANLPNAEEEWGQYEENTTKEDQVEHGKENVKISEEDKGNRAYNNEPEQPVEQINRENIKEEENREENIEFKQEVPEEQNENKEEENVYQPQEDDKHEHVENKEVTKEKEEEIVKHEETENKEVVNEENVVENRHEEGEKQEENLSKQEENQTQEGVEQTAHKEEEIPEQNKEEVQDLKEEEAQDHNNQVISNEENIHKEQNEEEAHQHKEVAAHEEGQTQQEEQNKEEIIEEKKIEDQVVEEKQGEQIEEHKEENIKGENNQEEENNEDKEDGEENESPQKGEEGTENEENKDKKKKKKKSNKKKKN